MLLLNGDLKKMFNHELQIFLGELSLNKFADLDNWVKTSPQPAYVDSGGSVTLITFMNDTALFVNGKFISCSFEEDGWYSLESLLHIAANLADTLKYELYLLDLEPDHDDEKLDDFMYDWTWDDVIGIVNGSIA